MNTTTHEEHLTTADLAGIARGESESAQRVPGVNEAHPLFLEDVANDFRAKWDRIQTGFVDEPRQAVQQADELVAQAIKRLAEIFATERASLEDQWARGGDASTEDLRVALRRYRAFFDRLLSV